MAWQPEFMRNGAPAGEGTHLVSVFVAETMGRHCVHLSQSPALGSFVVGGSCDSDLDKVGPAPSNPAARMKERPKTYSMDFVPEVDMEKLGEGGSSSSTGQCSSSTSSGQGSDSGKGKVTGKGKGMGQRKGPY